METNRIILIVMSELSLDNLRLQEALERAINSNEEVDKKVFQVKELLGKIALNDAMIEKFKSLVSPNNNNLNVNQNG